MIDENGGSFRVHGLYVDLTRGKLLKTLHFYIGLVMLVTLVTLVILPIHLPLQWYVCYHGECIIFPCTCRFVMSL